MGQSSCGLIRKTCVNRNRPLSTNERFYAPNCKDNTLVSAAKRLVKEHVMLYYFSLFIYGSNLQYMVLVIFNQTGSATLIVIWAARVFPP